MQSVLYLCYKHQFNECVAICADFLKNYLHFDQLYLGYQLAVYYGQNLKEYYKDNICRNAKQIVKTREQNYYFYIFSAP